MTKIVRVIDNLLLILIGVFSLVMVTSTFLQVIFRYALDHPLSWSEELSRYCFIWIVYLGAALAVKHGAHIGVDYLYKVLPDTLKNVVFVVTNLLILAFAGTVFYESVPVIGINLSQHSPAIGIPMGLVYLAIPTGFAAIFFYVVIETVSRVKGFRVQRGVR